MPSTYSPSLKIELIGNGEQSGTWGQTTNNNMGTLIEQAIAGVQPITLTGNYTLTNFNGLSDEARNAVLTFSGVLAAPANVVAPSVQKTYIITNNAGANVTIKTATGNGVTVQNGLSALIYCDGTDFYTAVNVNNVIGDLTVSGNETVAGYVTLGGNLTFANTIVNTTGNLTFTANSSIVDMSVNTGALVPPTGTTAQRPASPQVGMSRWNSDTGAYEVWTGVEWKQLASGTYALDYLIVAGGGTSGYGTSWASVSGGGAGGLLYAASYGGITPGNSYAVVVGAGGAGAGAFSQNGSNSSAFGQTAIGGGAGGGNSGGSGGGGGYLQGGRGTAGQGNNGGFGGGDFSSGGGGGAGAAGGGGNQSAGGNGLQYDITGTSTYYAGGGGCGSADDIGPAPGGLGGGGASGASYAKTGTSGTVNTGGGGGGVNTNSNEAYPPGQVSSGGSGVVIIRYASATQRGSGGTVTSYTSGSVTYWVHKFTSSGTYVA